MTEHVVTRGTRLRSHVGYAGLRNACELCYFEDALRNTRKYVRVAYFSDVTLYVSPYYS